MEAYIIDWLSLLARWIHFIVGIAWIGSSFYFIWLDNHLLTPAQHRPAALRNAIDDAYLAALAISRGATLVSFDQDFEPFVSHGLRWERPGS